MNTQIASQTILFSLSTATLWCMYQWLYKGYMIDHFRQEMFVLRDELFDEAADGLLPFDHQAYCTLRRAMNGCIRFGHKLSLLEVLILTSQTRHDHLDDDSGFSFSKRLDFVSNDLGDETKERLIHYQKKMGQLLTTHLFKMAALPLLVTAIVVIGLVIPLLLMLFLRSQLKSIFKKVMSQNLSNLESAALAAGRS